MDRCYINIYLLLFIIRSRLQMNQNLMTAPGNYLHHPSPITMLWARLRHGIMVWAVNLYQVQDSNPPLYHAMVHIWWSQIHYFCLHVLNITFRALGKHLSFKIHLLHSIHIVQSLFLGLWLKVFTHYTSHGSHFFPIHFQLFQCFLKKMNALASGNK